MALDYLDLDSDDGILDSVETGITQMLMEYEIIAI
jgi:hypothetical protein